MSAQYDPWDNVLFHWLFIVMIILFIYVAQEKAKKLIKKTGNLPVPLQIRNAPTKLMKDLHYGKDYQYAQDSPDKLTNMKTMPPELEVKTFYHPSNQGNEIRFQKRLVQIKAWHEKNG